MSDIVPQQSASTPTTSRCADFVVIGFVAVLLGLVAAMIQMPKCASQASVSAAAEGPSGPFTLTDTKGQTVTDRTLVGNPYAIVFGFTRCPDVCPTTPSRTT